MNYLDGSKICVGDKVIVEGVAFGTVVISFDDQEFSQDYPKVDWPTDKEGIMIVFTNGAILYIENLEDPGEGPPIIELDKNATSLNTK